MPHMKTPPNGWTAPNQTGENNGACFPVFSSGTNHARSECLSNPKPPQPQFAVHDTPEPGFRFERQIRLVHQFLETVRFEPTLFIFGPIFAQLRKVLPREFERQIWGGLETDFVCSIAYDFR
jgi:hypothetical protein